MLTETSIRDILQSLQWSYDAAPSGEGVVYSPTLIVGLGGTGIRCLRFLKKYLRHNEENRVELLGIECDNSENEKYPELPRLYERTELMLMDANAAIGRMTHARQNPEKEESQYLLSYLPNDHGTRKNIHTEINDCIRNNKGAGQRRRAGRVIFEANTNGGCNLIAEINSRNQELRGLQTKQELIQRGYHFTNHVKVYVVTSLAGGTGAGSIISCLGLLRSIFDQDGDTITVLGVLPGERLDRHLTRPSEEMPATRANALALLRELQATRLQDFPDYRFQFGIANNFNPVVAAKSLADGVFVVDHELHDGTAVPDYLDICHSMAVFLYSLVGTGMGSVQDAGNINAAAGDNAALHKEPPVLQAFGVSCLAYPTDEMEEYTLRHIVDQWSGHWLGQVRDDGAVQQAIGTAKQALKLENAQVFQNHFLNAIEIPGSAYLDTDDARENAVKHLSDADLISEADVAKGKLKETVKLFHSALDAAADKLGKELLEEADKAALRSADGGTSHAQSFLEGLIFAAKTMGADLTAIIAQNIANIEEIENETIPKKERWLKLLPGNLLSNRTGFIDAVDELLRMMAKAALAPYMQEALEDIVQRLEKHQQALAHTTQGLITIKKNNEAAMSKTVADDRAGYGVVQFALRPAEFPSFVQGIHSPFPERLQLADLSQDSVIKAVVAQMYPPYQQAIASKDLAADVVAELARNDNRITPLANMVRSLDSSALPRMRFRDNLPQPEQMSPQKFVAGKGFSLGNHPLLRLFTRPAGGVAQVHAISIQNSHQIICMQTFENFGVGNWKQYDNCVPHYEKDKWWRHILPEALIEKLPLLRNQA